MEKLKNRRISVALDQETCEKLFWLAEKDARTVSGLIRQMIGRYIRADEASTQKPLPPDER